MFFEKKVIAETQQSEFCEHCASVNKIVFKIEHSFHVRGIPLFPYKWSYVAICQNCEQECSLKKSEVSNLIFSLPKSWWKRFYGIPCLALIVAGVIAFCEYENKELLKTLDHPEIGMYYQFYDREEKLECVFRIIGVEGEIVKIQTHKMGYEGGKRTSRNRKIKQAVCVASNDESQWGKITEVHIDYLRNQDRNHPIRLNSNFKCH